MAIKLNTVEAGKKFFDEFILKAHTYNVFRVMIAAG